MTIIYDKTRNEYHIVINEKIIKIGEKLANKMISAGMTIRKSNYTSLVFFEEIKH